MFLVSAVIFKAFMISTHWLLYSLLTFIAFYTYIFLHTISSCAVCIHIQIHTHTHKWVCECVRACVRFYFIHNVFISIDHKHTKSTENRNFQWLCRQTDSMYSFVLRLLLYSCVINSVNVFFLCVVYKLLIRTQVHL